MKIMAKVCFFAYLRVYDEKTHFCHVYKMSVWYN